jgi:hypothetical protein
MKNYSKTGNDQEFQYNFRMIKYFSVTAGLSIITIKLEMIKNVNITA